EKRAGEVWKDGRDSGRARHVRHRPYTAVLACGDDQPALSEAEVQTGHERALRLRDEIPSRDPGIGGAIRDELGDVLRPHEDCFEFAAERRGERAVAAGPDLEAGVGEQVA